ncbi:stage III sporulation protein AC [Inconstantimicrobium mannanitabidum]|uniref:Stage III sporulation protein AC n=1 Tax=Inconstantimicrobium mannanitabidum TaxID=1604901 RepID=A0ACB5RAK3_9CLOT|nr:stage III sporulation protein AC [Clostridium sp. TW13]GKX66147.1 stage III sporulation protein AC [Clostridium sp. TW13]
MFDLSMIFKIAGVGVILIIIDKVLKSSGKDEIATIANLAGVIILLSMVVTMIVKLFDTVKTMFYF